MDHEVADSGKWENNSISGVVSTKARLICGSQITCSNFAISCSSFPMLQIQKFKFEFEPPYHYRISQIAGGKKI
jgi:hypothetical protein